MSGVKFIHGRPYHPQSQGFIERLNKRVQESLNIAYGLCPEKFDLQISLNQFIEEYNKTYHHSIHLSPASAFALDPDNKSHKPRTRLIKQNLITSFERKISLIDYVPEQKLLIYNYVSKKKVELVKPNKENVKVTFNKGFFIPAIVNAVNQSTIDVKIMKDSVIIKGKVKRDEIYKIQINLVHMVSEKQWEDMNIIIL